MAVSKARHSAASLLHPTYGYGAADIRRAVGASHNGRIARAEQLIDGLRRMEALHRKGFRGLALGDNRTPVTPDRNGQVQGYSAKPTVIILDRDPSDNPHAFYIDLDIDVLRGLLDIPTPCDCCIEDVVWTVIYNPGLPIGVVFNALTCTAILNLGCNPCLGGGGGGGA